MDGKEEEDDHSCHIAGMSLLSRAERFAFDLFYAKNTGKIKDEDAIMNVVSVFKIKVTNSTESSFDYPKLRRRETRIDYSCD